jgi:hypothetical protein
MALSDVTAAADAYGNERYTQGKADQAVTDAAALAALRTENDDLHTALDDAEAQAAAAVTARAALQAEYDEYKRTHTVADPPPPPPPPPPSNTPVYGMNFEPKSSAVAPVNKPYEPKAKVARIYIADGQTNIRNEDEVVRALDLGIDTLVLSSKDTSVSKWYGTVPAGIKWYGINHHEPENDGIAPATWKAWQAIHLPAIRAAGGIPSICLMSYTVNPRSGRNVADWKLPARQADVVYWDYYPNKEANPTRPAGTTIQQITMTHIKAGNTTLGISRWGIGEYGIQRDSIYNATTVAEFKSLIKNDAEVACYWSNQQAQDQRFTDPIAAAWYAA